MDPELVRYEGNGNMPVLTETVSDFASAVLNPLFGPGKLASRILAFEQSQSASSWRRPEVIENIRNGCRPCALRTTVPDRHSSRFHDASVKVITVVEQANAGDTGLAIRQIESNHHAASQNNDHILCATLAHLRVKLMFPSQR